VFTTAEWPPNRSSRAKRKKYSLRTAAMHPPNFDALNPRSVLVCNH